ncbi:hypothetical protein ACFSTD_04510 [Novosphingobium colocasiae]|uniref:S-adenosyl-L-homocysteine hydrolase n=2 Tax=Bacteria TaxID=2 RepID=A0A918PJ45_9SPHN|nr:hypothetical protein [Novosphingobium colocasiae]GGZ12125.1 hypothetical protein GCM10011614_29110 [Novosphingobium colocasiae]
MRNTTILAAAAALLLSTTAQAATCADNTVVEASRIQEFHTGMLVTQMRCRTAGLDFAPSLIAFETALGKQLVDAEHRLTTHLAAQDGAGAHDLDNFVTRLGNRYGQGPLTLTSCAAFRDVADALSQPEAGDATLAFYARAMVPTPPLATQACAVQIARRAP